MSGLGLCGLACGCVIDTHVHASPCRRRQNFNQMRRPAGLKDGSMAASHTPLFSALHLQCAFTDDARLGALEGFKNEALAAKRAAEERLEHERASWQVSLAGWFVVLSVGWLVGWLGSE